MDPIFVLDRPHVPITPVVQGCRTVGEVLLARAARSPSDAAHFAKTSQGWVRTNWDELLRQTRQVAHGLAKLGVGAGDRVAILGPTSADWARYDLGSHLLGAVTVGVYPMQSSEQVRYLLEHSESRVIFVSGEEELATSLAAAEGMESLHAIVPWQEELAARHAGTDKVLSPAAFRTEAMAEGDLRQGLAQVDPEDMAILVYTSGTTGPPKAAMISHANILTLLEYQADILPFFEDDLLLSFLPMAHVTERNLGFYTRLNAGVPAAYASSIGAVLQELQEVAPTIFGSVPRLFEKAYAKIQGEVSRKPGPVRALFAWAESVGRRRIRHELAGEPIPVFLGLQHKLASALVFAKIRQAFGGRVRACLTGAAPISLDILEFLWGAGLPIYEGYGMTEATVITNINRLGAVKLGTVGRAAPCVEQKIAEDGEILLRGPLIFKGYLRNEEATAEALEGGWLHSGDIGEIDADGFLRITDRKKHLIITAGGKNVAPANIERAIKNQSPLISQVHAHGDRRPFISALIAPSPLETLEWGTAQGLLAQEEMESLRDELMANPSARSAALNQAMASIVETEAFQRLFVEPVSQGNHHLARVEKVRRFFLLDRDLSQEEGELTPTMKMKRKAIEEKFAGSFDRLYAGEIGLDAEVPG